MAQYVEEIIISPEVSVIELGKSVQLTATALPEDAVNKNIKWSADEGTYARSACISVTSNGLAKGISVGNGYVTAYTAMVSTRVSKRMDIRVVNPEGAVLVNRIVISPGSLNMKLGEKVKLTATVSPSNANYKGIFWSVAQGAVTTVDQEGNVTAVRVGGSRIIARSADGNAEAWISVTVTEDGPDKPSASIDGPDYVTFTMPTELEVERGQEFPVWVRGFEAKNRYKNFFSSYFSGKFNFTPSSSQIQTLSVSTNDTAQREAWFKAGEIPGTYEIRVEPKFESDAGYGTTIVKVRVVDKIFSDNIVRLTAGTSYVCFRDDGVTPRPAYGEVPNPYRLRLGWVGVGETNAKTFTADELKNIGWHILNDGIVSKIEYDGSYLKIHRGSKYGITQVIFYLKSNPHIYFPIWIEWDGGNYQYYLTDGGRPWSTTPDEPPTPSGEDTPSGGGDTPSGGGGSSDNTPAANSATFFTELGETEEITGITSVGNTLIVSTNENMYYFLWKNGQYNFLGNKIPIPAIHFRMGGLESLRTAPDVSGIDIGTLEKDKLVGFSRMNEEGIVFAHENPGDKYSYGASSKKYVFDLDFEKGFWNEYLDTIWGEIDRIVREQSLLGKAVFPMFVRYAVRLYDGTLYSQSIPILLGAEISRFVDAKTNLFQYVSNDDEERHAATMVSSYVEIADGYSIVMNADGETNIYDGWEDIVQSVDVFVSQQITPIQRDAAKLVLDYIGDLEFSYSTGRAYMINDLTLDPYYTVENQDKMILNYQNTYLAKSFPVNEFKALSGDKKLEIDTSSDYIMAQEALKETPWSMHYTKGRKLFNYNKRLLMTGVEQVLSSGYQFLHSVSWKLGDAVMADSSFRFLYYLRGENGESVVISRDANGNALIQRQKKAVVSGDPTLYTESPYAWLAYPDSRCYKIEMYEAKGNSVIMSSYTTRVFDQADVAYAFIGFGQQFNRPVDTDMSVGILPSYENRVYKMPSSLVVSKVNNPFIFAAEDVVTFTAGELMNIAVATRPLSEGQFGQFPLYVFTDEGVFALSTDNQGRFLTSHPVSRDVLIGDDALTGIEQGVFFAAARGLLLLQGSTVTKVSAVMDGAPDELGPLFAQEISRTLMDSLAIEFPARFSEFIKGCRMAYDYANSRIVLFRDDTATQYVYKFDTQSWHRMNTGIGSLVRALNSYPEALVVSRTARGQSVYNLSVTSESDQASAVPGMVYTRDLILDGADIYKTVSRLKVRGRFKNGHVRWQLQGSNDGLNYQNIHSLRGPSWKWYRIVLVSRLSPNERVSYIELDYEPKFVDKIR